MAIDDLAFITAVNQPVTVPVLANDYVDGAGTLVIDTITPPSAALGTVTMVDAKTLRYTPAVLQDVDFTYRAKDASQPSVTASATVAIRRTGLAVSVAASCVDGNCTFVATPTDTRNIVSYKWTWGDDTPGQPVKLPARVNHRYATDGYKAVTVVVEYATGEMVAGSVTAEVSFSRRVTWTLDAPEEGLAIAVRNISGLETFPAGTTVSANWSPNAADCDWGCGPGNFVNGGGCVTSCDIASDPYNHEGTYAMTLRLASPGESNDYPIIVTVRNRAPAPDFTVRHSGRAGAYERHYIFTPELNDDGPEPWEPLQWDFGDGTTSAQELYTGYVRQIGHLFKDAGTYDVSVTMRDGDGKIGVRTRTVEVINQPPIPKMRIDCALLDCEFGAEPTVDDGTIEQWQWNGGIPNATSAATTMQVTYPAAGCYQVSLTATDEGGVTASEVRTVPVGPSVRNPVTNVVTDAHVTTLSRQPVSPYYDFTDGNLNGIAEPGETITVEPQWAMAPAGMVHVKSGGTSSTNGAWASAVIHNLSGWVAYDSSAGFTDCRGAGGRCYVVEIRSDGPSARSAERIHTDVSWPEYHWGTGSVQTPGSPVKVHIGESFADVPVSHWAYGWIESILHANLTVGCGNGNYCPARPLSRAEAAAFLAKYRYPGWTPVPCTGANGPFTDVPCGHWAEPYITRLKNDGIVAGSQGLYRPEAETLRVELAVMVLRAKIGSTYTPPACTPEFSDVPCPGYWGAGWASAAKALGVTPGCGPSQFCPERIADRAQAAAFLTRAFGLSIHRTACPVPVAYDPAF